MMNNKSYTLNVSGRLLDLSVPQVMGILNVTPDSFYAASRLDTNKSMIKERALTIIKEGASMIDIGAYSSRPGAQNVSEDEEMRRLAYALEIIHSIPESKNIILSVDTFRAQIARRCVEDYGVNIINDISGGTIDPILFDTIADLGVPYILMHIQGTPQTMQIHPQYNDLMHDIFLYFANKISMLRKIGVKDIILDPGFGFGKSLADNYKILKYLDDFKQFHLPLLVGVSRKSMIYKLFDTTPEDSLNGTTAIHAFSLEHGANILRVHDVKAACEVVKIHTTIQQ